MFICSVCGNAVNREQVRHNVVGLPFCQRCYDLFGQREINMPGDPLEDLAGAALTDATLAEWRQELEELNLCRPAYLP